MADAAIECNSVWKSYRVYHQQSNSLKERIITRRNSYEEFWALKDVSLEVERGSTLGLIGSNGSGKSTLLKVLARILTPNRGEVQIRGTMSSLLELGTGFHPELTGSENVYLAGSLMGQSSKAMKAKYDEIVDFAGIEAFMDLPVKNYSTGMYARLAFAVAISVDPEILMIDEVLSVGDAEFQAKCYDRISEFRAQGRTIVIVSHSLESIRTMCDHAVWLEKGVVRSIGTADDVVSTYLVDVHSTDTAHQDEVTNAAADRWGNRQIEITDVDIAGDDAESAVRTFQSMAIRIGFTVNKAPKDPREFVGNVVVYRAEDQELIFGLNTVEEKANLVLRGDHGVIQIDVSELPLVPGNYLVSVGLCDRSFRHVYDWHERRYRFTVLKNPKANTGFGIVQVKTDWSLTAASKSTL